MQNSIVKKSLVVGIIFLFIGIGIAPSVTSIDISKNKTVKDNLVEIDVQLFKPNGIEDHKMYITQEQNEQLDILIENFKQDIEKSESYEESVGIYKNMVVSLNKLGVLPKGMTVDEAQRLVTGRFYRFSKFFSLLQQFIKSAKKSNIKLPEQNRGDIYENLNCLLTSHATKSSIWLLVLKPFSKFVTYGVYTPPSGPNEPSNGWIFTRARNTKWVYEGNFHGELGEFGCPPMGVYTIGADYFVGFKLPTNLIFGFASHVKIETGNPP